MASIHSLLTEGLNPLLDQYAKERETQYGAHSGSSALPPLPSGTMTDAVRDVWATATTAPNHYKTPDILRSALDMVGRDVALRPVIEGTLPEPAEDASEGEKAVFQTTLQDRLDVVLTLYEVVGAENTETPTLEPGAPFIPLLEEFVELLSVSTWHTLFRYVETRAPRFCRNMPASKGKALPLLRTINAFLRILSHTPQDLKLRGRVQLFASSAISVSDKSAINVRGEYAALTTTWEEDEKDTDGDVDMEGDKQPDFYSTLWSLQKYFAYPPSLDGPAVGEPAQTPFEEFRTKSDFVLSRLFEQTKRERVLRGKNGPSTRKRTRESDDLSYPRYLTAKSLLEYEIADQQFRRQILLQYFILIQFLLSLTPGTANKQQFTGGMPKTFVIEGDNQVWVTSTVQAVREELRRMEPDGQRFEDTVVQLMSRERRYAQWKNDGCPEKEWEILPVPATLASSSAEKWKRQCRPMRRWPYKLGTPGVTRAWETGYKGISDWKKPEEKTVFELEEELSRIEMDEEDDKAMGRQVSPDIAEQKRTIRWCALRAARKAYPRVVSAMKAYDLHKLVQMIRDAEAKRAGASQPEVAVVEVDGEEGTPEGEAEAEPEPEPEPESEAEGEVEREAEAAEDTGAEGGAEEAETKEVKLAQLPDDEPQGESGEDVAMAEEEGEPRGDLGEGQPKGDSGEGEPKGDSKLSSPAHSPSLHSPVPAEEDLGEAE